MLLSTPRNGYKLLVCNTGVRPLILDFCVPAARAVLGDMSSLVWAPPRRTKLFMSTARPAAKGVDMDVPSNQA